MSEENKALARRFFRMLELGDPGMAKFGPVGVDAAARSGPHTWTKRKLGTSLELQKALVNGCFGSGGQPRSELCPFGILPPNHGR